MTTRPPSAHGPWCTRCRNHSTQSSGDPVGFCSSGTLHMERWTRWKLKWWNIIKLMRSCKCTPLVVTNKAFRKPCDHIISWWKSSKTFWKANMLNQYTAYESADVKIHCRTTHSSSGTHLTTAMSELSSHGSVTPNSVWLCWSVWEQMVSAPVLIHLQPWSYLTTARTFHFTFSMSTEEASCNSGGSYFAF